MLPQELAVQKICTSLKGDPLVQALFLKGSMGRNEHDEHSDVDLYCLVNKEDEKQFLENRLKHLRAYREIIFLDDIFIVAPQIIAVFDNLLHIDLFTVTQETFVEKDFFKVLYDPHHIMENFIHTQGLTLTADEYQDDVMDVAWFLFQYEKSAARGNDIWSVRMLTNVVYHLARVLLYRYAPERAQLGLKAVEQSLPESVVMDMIEILECLIPSKHAQAANQICQLVGREYEWIYSHLIEEHQLTGFFKKMVLNRAGDNR